MNDTFSKNMAQYFVPFQIAKYRSALASSFLGFGQICANPAPAAAAIVLASLALLQSAPAQAVNLVTNGDFETGNLSGWTNLGGNQGVGVYGLGGNNTNVAYFPSSSQLGFIAQSVTTIAGQNYVLSYDFFSNGSIPNQFQVKVNNTTLFDQENIPEQTAFTPYSFNFVGTGLDTIQFGGRHFSYVLVLDNVVVDAAASTAVPEPFTIIGTLVGGTMAVRMRKKLKSKIDPCRGL
jgi:hypothetical protein